MQKIALLSQMAPGFYLKSLGAWKAITVTKSVRPQICATNYQKGDQRKNFLKKFMRPPNITLFLLKNYYKNIVSKRIDSNLSFNF